MSRRGSRSRAVRGFYLHNDPSILSWEHWAYNYPRIEPLPRIELCRLCAEFLQQAPPNRRKEGIYG